jgi:hypothetical protein
MRDCRLARRSHLELLRWRKHRRRLAARRLRRSLVREGGQLGRRERDVVEAARRGAGGARELFGAEGVFVYRCGGVIVVLGL